MTSKKARN
uniref:Uncharacterized protein n=1 Tax=Rhizophora mucronata TaxID=61149 RepID=A0A2P2M9M9_RHIMU